MTTTPEKLGKYQITGVLGEGAMGVVYRGFDPGIGRQVALKTIRRKLLEADDQGAAMAARFRNEAQAAGRLQHPGIVAVYDYGDEADIAYIAMEFVEGHSLSRMLGADSPLTDDDKLSLMSQLLDALEHAHGHGVWHRDIKPANLLLTKDGRLKIADFGIARIESAALTQATTVVGTPGYMSPEQFTGRGVDRRADVYAAGVILYQLLVGRPPFSGTPASLMYRVVNEAPVLPSAVPGCARLAPYDEVVAIALAKDPAARYPSAADFKRALLAVAGRAPEATLSSDTMVTAMRSAVVPAGAPPTSPSTAAHWDKSVLAQVEAMLARHVGPLAGVMVRRAARDCADLPSLYARLAESVTNPAARTAFVAQVNAARTSGSTKPPPAAPSIAVPAISDTMVAQSARLLAQHVGPIAPVIAKRAAAKARGREAFFMALEESVTDPVARAKLHAELERLKP